jgi:rhodanese-related sulfurtransferase
MFGNNLEVEASWLKEERHGDEAPLLLDVRELEERAGGFIPGSLHIPMAWIPFRAMELDPRQPIVVYCAHGVRSARVADFLLRKGYSARSLRGGIFGWLAAGGEIAHG